MRYVTALVLAIVIGAAASLYTPSAQAAGVYVGIGLPVPVPGVVPAVPAYYPYAPAPYIGVGFVGPRFWGYGYRGYYGYAHPGYFYRGGYGFHRH
jgi:hypothetical protein